MENKEYSLDIKNDIKRIFVTQLREDEEEEENEIKPNNVIIQRMPIVKEKAGQLIEIGYNTHQKTLLLKRQADVTKINEELIAKKEEFTSRMEKCKQQEKRLNREREKLTQRTVKFNKFIEDNDAKKTRALNKYQNEIKLRLKKEDELLKLNDELDNLKNRLCKLKEKISRYRKYEDFLTQVADELPEDYLESSDNMIHSLMMRHQTLNELNTNLLQHRDDLNKQIKESQQTLQDSSYVASQMLMVYNRESAETRNALESLRDQNDEMEMVCAKKGQKYFSSSEELSKILLAIENLSSFCGRQDVDDKYPTPELKLNLISAFLRDREDVYRVSSNVDSPKIISTSRATTRSSRSKR